MERRLIYRVDDGKVVNIWDTFDPTNSDHSGWSPPSHLALGPAHPNAQIGDTFNGNSYIPQPPRPIIPRPPVDVTPGTLDVFQYMIEEGITTRVAVVSHKPELDAVLP